MGTVKLIIFIVAAVLFGLEAFHVKGPIAWTPAAFCLLVIGLLLVGAQI